MKTLNRTKQIKKLILSLGLLIVLINPVKGQVVDSISQSYTHPSLSVYINIVDNYGFHFSSVNYQIQNDTLKVNICIVNHFTTAIDSKDVTLQIAMFSGTLPNHYIVDLHNGINCTNLISSQYYPSNITTGINEKSAALNNSINIYPNPTKEFINLSLENNLKISEITLYDMAGRVAKIYESTQRKIDVKDINSGQYFLKIKTEKGVITKKVLLE